ncbi:hypothetical protein B6A10_06000 [Flavobacterium sp. L1I52]|uniref:Sulfatase N-terminal domain-containing protein n=1 Tax=Flavobacterium pokkalii TaxID=1940408 RepID=A0ABR7UPB5_9FLAO|nr:sulfatase [Flavobacterium pokkalii]MBD0724726.1 hypothetical protein [Flavobacterium pokkalii]
MKGFYSASLFFMLFLVVFDGFAQPSKSKTEKQPNLVFIFADQYRRPSLGFLNEDPVVTPNIDQLAKEGVFFSKAVANHPLCSPYRGMLMTGKYPLSNGVIANCQSSRTEFGNYLKKEEITFSDVLVNNGYSAAYVGKWHLDGPKPTKPGEKMIWDAWCPPENRHGFTFWHAYGTHNSHNTPYYWTTNAKENEITTIKEWSPIHEADVIIDYLKNQNNQRANSKPFALFWSINPPHTPFTQVPDKYKKQYEGRDYKELLNRPNVQFTNNKELKRGDRGVDARLYQAPDYFASVNGVDEQIGRVVQQLKDMGIYDNTIIVFSADHGEMLGSQGLMHKNVWFRESYEIPFIVHYPKKVKPKTEDLLISVPDYMPTLLGLMGLSHQIPKTIEGKDFSNVFYNKSVIRPDKQLYFGSEPENPSSGTRGFRNADYTFAVVKDEKGSKFYYLYNDKKDPYQMTNLWGIDKDLDKKMERELEVFLRQMKDPW